MRERRTAKRYSAEYCLETGGPSKNRVFRSKDISKGGVSFQGDDCLNERDGVSIKLFLKSRMIELKAVVVHVKDIAKNVREIGLKFLETPAGFDDVIEKEMREIEELLKKLDIDDREENFRRASAEYQKRNLF